FFEFEPRLFLRDRNEGRKDEQYLLQGELELEFALGQGGSAYFRPRVFLDLADSDVKRFEPYEAYVTIEREDWDLRMGQFVENWGIADTYNPIDVINRRDLATDFLDTDRLGELGFRYRAFMDGGETLGEPTLSLYALPIWQATPFPTENQRFGFASESLSFDEDAGFEPEGLDRALFATRFQSTLTTDPLNADLQLLVAHGPERMPSIAVGRGGVLAPAYYGATTFGAGLRAVPNQDVLGEFLSTLTLKAEVVFKDPYAYDDSPIAQPQDYLSYVVGVDRSFYDVLREQDTLTMTVEYAVETGADDASSDLRLFQNDVVLRGLWEAGDFARTSIEMRAIVDLDESESIAEAIYQRQLRSVHEDLKLTLQFQHFNAGDEQASVIDLFPDNTSVAVGLRWDF
ncbi:MAG: hypothetical protein ACI841_001796, partial [Planctomycetota bacterium]